MLDRSDRTSANYATLHGGAETEHNEPLDRLETVLLPAYECPAIAAVPRGLLARHSFAPATVQAI
ncbi:MAG: hypothetical protein CMH50_12200 [Myxococcales bacterium]|nr:hypothetical protein [Myxococcales bacterium]